MIELLCVLGCLLGVSIVLGIAYVLLIGRMEAKLDHINRIADGLTKEDDHDQ